MMIEGRPWAQAEMDEAVALSILGWAAAAHPLEACGLLLGPAGGPIAAATLAPNVAPAPEHAFEIDPAHIASWQRRARDAGQQLIGCWHSHPDGSLQPSAADRAGAGWPGLLWLIAGNGRLALWRPEPGGFRPVMLVRSDRPA